MAGRHEHGSEGHTHGVSDNADGRYLAIALALIVGFMLTEVIVGVIASSLVLISDAGHMLTDAGAISLSLITMRLAARPAKGDFTYGLKRTEILSAQANGITLLLLAAWFVYEAVRRLISPPEVEGGLVLLIALIGIVVNLLATWAIGKADRQSLNVEGSFQHILTDLYAFIATAVAGGVIYFTGGFDRADAIAALLAGEKAVTKATITVPAEQLECGNGTMNEHMKKALKVKDNPTIEFTVESYTLAKAADGTQAQLNGTLTLGGVTKPITVSALGKGEGDALRVTGVYEIRMTEYGLKPPTLMLGTLKVNERVKVSFDLLLKN
jgi:polyisoprenoid-binding protein YceI